MLLVPPVASAEWNSEIAMQGSLLFAPAILGEDQNGVGGEKLIANMGLTPGIGTRIGLYGERIGFAANAFYFARQISVENEFGVDFPNHGLNPLSFSGSVVLRFGDRFQPHLSLGGGFFLMSVDLDNVHGQELFFVPSLEAAAGIKFHNHGKGKFLYTEYRIYKTTKREPIRSMFMQSVVIGIGIVR